MDLKNLVRKNIWDLVPYSSARSEHKNLNGILLDANENSLGSVLDNGLNRYPDPYQEQLKSKIAHYKKIDSNQIFIGNGSDEAIDLLIRAFCEPGHDKIVVFPPTYGVYRVFAETNNVQVVSVDQSRDFSLDVSGYNRLESDNIKLTFICDPNNPSGNCYSNKEITAILDSSDSLVVIDEAYIDFASRESWLSKLLNHPNLIVLQTLSKAWGLAGIRIGMAFASAKIIDILNKVKYPYNVNQLTQQKAIEALNNYEKKDFFVKELIKQRQILVKELSELDCVLKIYPSEANFLLVKFKEAILTYQYLLKNNIVIRDRSNQLHCESCLRITVGTEKENKVLIDQLKNWT